MNRPRIAGAGFFETGLSGVGAPPGVERPLR